MKTRVEKDKIRRELVKRLENKRKKYKFIATKSHTIKSLEEKRFNIMFKLSKLPKDSSKTRIKNRCVLTGRSKAVYRQFKLSRIMLRDFASEGKIMGLAKYNW